MDGDAKILGKASLFPFPVTYVKIFKESRSGNILVSSKPEVAVRLHASVSHENERAVLVGQVQIVHEQVRGLEKAPPVGHFFGYSCLVEPYPFLVGGEVQVVGPPVETLVHVKVDSPSIS